MDRTPKIRRASRPPDFTAGVNAATSALTLPAAFTLTAPLDYQLIQRSSATAAHIPIRGNITEPLGQEATVRVVTSGPDPWQIFPPSALATSFAVAALATSFAVAAGAPAGGWDRVEARLFNGENLVAESTVAHSGVGEVWVVAGQSNSGNRGEERQTTRTGRIASFDGSPWQLANDPQAGARGNRGSFRPPLGDLLVERCNVPIGFIPCGLGGSSVRAGLPAGATFPNPPTVESRVRALPDVREAPCRRPTGDLHEGAPGHAGPAQRACRGCALPSPALALRPRPCRARPTRVPTQAAPHRKTENEEQHAENLNARAHPSRTSPQATPPKHPARPFIYKPRFPAPSRGSVSGTRDRFTPAKIIPQSFLLCLRLPSLIKILFHSAPMRPSIVSCLKRA